MEKKPEISDVEWIVRQSFKRGCLVMLGFILFLALALIGLWQIIQWIVH